MTHPRISDLRLRAKARIPHFVWEFLDSSTGTEATQSRNRVKLDELLFRPAVLKGAFQPDFSTRFLGRTYPLPLGIAPVGMSGLIWPRAEVLLAQHAASAGIPYTLSTVASRTPEEVGPSAGDQGWFQLYPPGEASVRRDMLSRARAAGFHTLVMTVDIPAPSRRERQLKGGLTQPARMTPRIIAQALTCPRWSIGMLRAGLPRLKFIESYTSNRDTLPSNAHIGYQLRVAPDWDYLRALRDDWQGPLIIKGILDPKDASRMEGLGIDAIWVSNHAGRQFDAAPATVEVLPQIRAATNLPLIFDGGVETGLDVMRAMALGADFTMMGRGWHYALAAFGAPGLQHAQDIIAADMAANMAQIGAASLSDLKAALYHAS